MGPNSLMTGKKHKGFPARQGALAVDTGNVQAAMTSGGTRGEKRAQRRGRVHGLRIAMS